MLRNFYFLNYLYMKNYINMIILPSKIDFKKLLIFLYILFNKILIKIMRIKQIKNEWRKEKEISNILQNVKILVK